MYQEYQQLDSMSRLDVLLDNRSITHVVRFWILFMRGSHEES